MRTRWITKNYSCFSMDLENNNRSQGTIFLLNGLLPNFHYYISLKCNIIIPFLLIYQLH